MREALLQNFPSLLRIRDLLPMRISRPDPIRQDQGIYPRGLRGSKPYTLHLFFLACSCNYVHSVQSCIRSGFDSAADILMFLYSSFE